MKAHEFISRLDEAKFGRRRITEDNGAVADAPSHAPKSSAGYTTPSSGKSKDEGTKMGGEKDAIKQSKSSIPAPVAKAPSHAPTDGKDYTTKGKGSSEDQGEKIDKSAVKENIMSQLIDSDEVDIEAIMAEAELTERGGHKPGCGCGFCKNKGSFGKKKADDDSGDDSDDKDKKDDVAEGLPPMRRPMAPQRPSTGRLPGAGGPPGRRLGGERMGFRHPAPRPKAALSPYQPSMEALDSSSSSKKTIRQLADNLLDAPDTR